jgi:hypothetical protein
MDNDIIYHNRGNITYDWNHFFIGLIIAIVV